MPPLNPPKGKHMEETTKTTIIKEKLRGGCGEGQRGLRDTAWLQGTLGKQAGWGCKESLWWVILPGDLRFAVKQRASFGVGHSSTSASETLSGGPPWR